MMRTHMFAAPALVAALLLPVHAAIIDWSGSTLRGAGTSLLASFGTPIEAQNMGPGGSISVDGVEFLDTDPLGPWPLSVSDIVPADLTGDSSFDEVLDSIVYELAGRSVRMEFDGLTPGRPYLLQLFVADTRECCSGRRVRVSDLSGNVFDSPALGDGFVFNGRFTADSASQSVIFSSVNSDTTYLNAWQLRDVPLPPIFLECLAISIVLIARSLPERREART